MKRKLNPNCARLPKRRQRGGQVDRWDVRNVAVVSGEAAEAQEYLVAHSQRIRRLAELQAERRLRDRKRGKVKSAGFSWINKKEVPLV